MPKFKKDDKVVFESFPDAISTVDKVSTSDGITKYKEPLYHISWPPTGKAVVRERQLKGTE